MQKNLISHISCVLSSVCLCFQSLQLINCRLNMQIFLMHLIPFFFFFFKPSNVSRHWVTEHSENNTLMMDTN